MSRVIPAPRTGHGRGHSGVSPGLVITLVGPSSGVEDVASANFTLGISGGALPGDVVVTPSAASGSFTPSTVTLTPGTPTGTFTYTPFVAGVASISFVNNSGGSISNPSPWAYTATPALATALSMTGPSSGYTNVGSAPFTVSANGAISGTLACTPSFGTGGGLLTPATVSLSNSSPVGTFIYTPYTAGTKTIVLSNDQGLPVTGSPYSYTVTDEVYASSSTYRSYLVNPNSVGTAGDPEGDGGSGPTRRLFSQHLRVGWDYVNGDYIDANGVKYNGTNAASLVPWHTLFVPLADPLGYTNLDVTALTAHWLSTGENKGAMLLCDSTTNAGAWVDASGTRSANPPKLVVVTTSGTFEVIGDLAGWAIGSEIGQDSRIVRRISRSYRCLLQFELLPDVPGDLISAHLKLYVEAKDDVYSLTVKIFETDAPALYLGAAGKPAVLGLADTVGEMSLPGHAQVYAAGDFRRSNVWNSKYDNSSDTGATPKYPAGIFTAVSIKDKQREATSFISDKVHAPGTTEYRGVLLTTQIGGGEMHYAPTSAQPDLTDPLRPIPSACPKEMYARLYIYFEDDFVSGKSDQFGFKMGLGWDAQFGIGNDELGWDAAAGSGQSDSYGCKFKWWSQPSTGPDPLTMGATEGDVWYQYDLGNIRLKLTNGVWVNSSRYLYVSAGGARGRNQWVYEGHSLRAHSGSFMGTTNTKYPNLIALNNAPSHLGNPPASVSPLVRGSYDVDWDGGVFGTEQALRIGFGPHNKIGAMFELGKWYCLETYLKMNSIDLSSPDANGNGRAINDGILRYWIDGALVGERTTMAWRLHPDIGVQGTYFIMYHGGVAGPIDPELGLPTGYPNAPMHYRLNNFVCAKEYIGPHVARNYPSGVNPPSDPPVTDGNLATFASTIGLSSSPTNRWIDTNIKPNGAWAVKAMVDGGRYATQAELEPNAADVGNFSANASDTLVNSNGAAWFPTKKQFFWFGGGHGGWMGNEVYWMDVPSMTWGRLTNPSPLARNPASSSGYGWLPTDGTPVSYHTYNGIVAVESLDSLFTMTGSPWPDGNFPNTDLWKFHIPTKTWTKVQVNAVGSGFRGPEAHWIPSLQKIALGQPNYWRLYDPFTNTLGTLLGGTSTMTNGNSVSTPTGIYTFGGLSGGTSCFYIAHAAIGVTRPTAIDATTHPRIWNHARRRDALGPWNSYLWDGIRNMVVSWSGSYNSEYTTGRTNVGKLVYAIDFANDHLYEFAVTGGTWATSTALGSYTKWQHLTDLDCYIGLNNRATNNGWMVFKPGSLTTLA